MNARVRATPHFLVCLEAARRFMVEQDAESAPTRFQRLQSELVRARGLLVFAPTSGRPARLLEASTDWGRYQAQQALALAQKVGMPELRELVLARHLLLYAHGASDVALLALRHERQLAYMLPA